VSKRIHYIDWLRVLAVLLLFPFHTLRVFNAGDPFYVKAAVTSMPVTYLLAFIDRWHMPLLFLLAGASTYIAMKKRTGGQYMGERAKRLLLPFVLGLLLIIPPQTWIGAQFNSAYSGSFLTYITSGDFLVWNIRNGGDYYGGFGVGHLWFVLWLFMVSLLALPLMLWSRGDRGRAWMDRWARRLAKPAWWLLPPALIWLGDGLPDLAGKNPFYYLAFFVLGALAFADESFGDAAERFWAAALSLGTVVTVAFIATGSLRNALPDPSVGLFLVNYTGFLGTWLMIVGFLGAGKKWLDRPSPVLAYLAEGSYPVYILHQTVIVLLAFVVITLPIAWPLQWVLLLVSSVAVTFALYEGARRLRPVRFTLGMKPAPAPAPASEQPA
jgi:glucans biosynthesis protein C